MPHLLIYNPNTNTDITHNISQMAKSTLPAWEITAQTAPSGPHYIATKEDLEWAANITENTLTPNTTIPYDAILIACFGDPAVATLKQNLTIPIFGMAETSFAVCSQKTASFSILTGGEEWIPLLMTLAHNTGYTDKINIISAIPSSGAHAQKKPVQTLKALGETARNLTHKHRTPHILLGGTGLAPFYQDLSNIIPTPTTCSFLGSLQGIQEHFG
ncbi:aspartate/glutamate racemase family protein [Neokomagataea thailandica]|nr:MULTISPECIES: aspartate/glutamate racemase family protein [Neokomagataea]